MKNFKRGGPSPNFLIFAGVSALLVVTCTARLEAGPTAGLANEQIIAHSASCKKLAILAGPRFIHYIPNHEKLLKTQELLSGYQGYVIYYSGRASGHVHGIIGERNMPGLTFQQKVGAVAAELYEANCIPRPIKGYNL